MIETHASFSHVGRGEFRACGEFNADQVSMLFGADSYDLRAIGCPEHIFLNLLRHRAQNPHLYGVRGVTPSVSQPPATTDAERRQRAAAQAREIAAQDAALDAAENSRRASYEPLRVDHAKLWEQN